MDGRAPEPQPVFGPFLLLRRIGRGGMAEIFRALQVGAQGVHRQVAIKRLLSHLGQDPHFVDMFINEAKLAALLDHANIVRIFEFGAVDERLYHCLEYVHGVTVMDLIRSCLVRREPMPIDLACFVFTEALYGLDHAHRQTDRKGAPLDMIHRDLTPSNLLVSFDGAVKVADFGIAKAAASSVHTQSGYIKGKFRYMSPEQAYGSELDQRSDLFSLAICFNELLTLKPMFHADGDLATLLKVRSAEFPRPRELNPAIPPALEDCLLRALARDRDARYPSAAAWLEELEQVVFACGLKRFRSDLRAAMRSWFGDVIERREAELLEEARRSEALLARQAAAGEAEEEPSLRRDAETVVTVQPARGTLRGGEEEPTKDLGPLRRQIAEQLHAEEADAAPASDEPVSDDRRPTLRDLPVVEELPAPADEIARPTLNDLPAAAPPPAEPPLADLGKRRTLQVPTVGPPPGSKKE